MLQLVLFLKNKKQKSKSQMIWCYLWIGKNLESYAPTNIFPYLVTPSSDEIQLLEFMELHKIEKKKLLY